MGVLFLFVFQVQTLYYSPDHKLVDGGLVIEGHSEVFGGEEDHHQFVQVLNSSCLASLLWRHFAWQSLALLYSLCLAMHKTINLPVPG